MNKLNNVTISLAVGVALAGATAWAAELRSSAAPSKPNMAIKHPARAARPSIPNHAKTPIPLAEPDVAPSSTSSAGMNVSSAFTASRPANVTPNTQSLSGPVTLNYSGNSYAFTVSDTGTNRGISATLSNTADGGSALFGETFGSGAGLTGFNAGTSGPGAKFQVVNANSAQAGAFATTNGTGSAILGTITKSNSDQPAILGQNQVTANYGIGVEGEGNSIGVYGLGTAYGVYGSGQYGVVGIGGSSSGVYAFSSSGDGMDAYSDQGAYALYAEATENTGIYGTSDSSDGGAIGIYGFTTAGYGLYGVTTAAGGYGTYGQSTNGEGVVGVDYGSGNGIYGTSSSGYAGYFDGNVYVSGTLNVDGTSYSSDRNIKTDFRPIDGKDVLERVNQLPISSWEYKKHPQLRHVGPMAQDFHAAFGLNGEDETRISEVDIAGISLAAIQELSNQMKSKDQQISELKAQLTAQTKTTSDQAKLIADMKAMTEGFAKRVSALEEQQHSVTTQTAALR